MPDLIGGVDHIEDDVLRLIFLPATHAARRSPGLRRPSGWSAG